jgi:N-acetyltransferase
MELQPALQGKLLRLRPLAADDFEDLYLAASDPRIWEQHPENTRCKREVFESFFAKAMESGGAFAIIDAHPGAIIGTSRYYDHDSAARSVFVGYTFLARKYWGGRFNRELKCLMLQHAFRFVDTVLFHVGAQNFRSQKALLKIGAGPIPRLQSAVEPETLVFGIGREKFEREFRDSAS